MDEHTWGNAPAAVNLVKLLELESDKVAKSVRKKLTLQIDLLNAVMDIRNSAHRKALLLKSHQEFKALVAQADWAENIKTHVACVETGIFRAFQKI